MRNILFIAEFFPPPQHSGTLRSEAFVRHLPEFGINPIVFTSAEAERRAKILGVECTQDKQGGHSRPVVEKMPWHQGDNDRDSALQKLALRIPYVNSLHRSHRRKKILTRVGDAVKNLIRNNHCEAIFATSGPPEALLIAMESAITLKIPFVVDLRDPWSYQPSIPYRHYVDFCMEKRLERRVLRSASKVIVTARATAELLMKEFQLASQKIAVIENGYEENDFSGLEARESKNELFTIVHAGQLAQISHGKKGTARNTLKKMLGFDYDPLRTDYSTRSYDSIMKIVQLLHSAYPSMKEKFKFVLVGCGNNTAKGVRAQSGESLCIEVLPRVDAQRAAKICIDADLLLLLQTSTFLNGQPFCVAIAAKLYTYLRTGRRILVSSQGDEMKSILERHNAGIHVPAGDSLKIAQAIFSEFQEWESSNFKDFKQRDCHLLSRSEKTRILASTLCEVMDHR